MTATSLGDPLVGRVLDGRYEVLARLARGGMATVYRAHDHRLGRTVAVKVMHDGLGDDVEFARKFDREARCAATLSNPHVVGVFDQGVDGGRPYIVMEFVTGCTLRHVITREAPLPPLRALEVMEHVASALASAHEAGLVHRDVKPENVLLSDRGQVKVADFGLARAMSNQTATATQGLLIGTVSYLPPELVTTGRADARSDVYSTGVVLFEMLTGQKPHKGETPIQVAYSHVHSDIPRPSTLLAGNDPRSMDSRRIIPPYLDELVVACTRREPAERPADGRDLLRLIRTAKRALSHGILDDPALTAQMGACVERARQQRAERAAAAAVVAAAEVTGAAQAATWDDDAPTAVQPAVGATVTERPAAHRPGAREHSVPMAARAGAEAPRTLRPAAGPAARPAPTPRPAPAPPRVVAPTPPRTPQPTPGRSRRSARHRRVVFRRRCLVVGLLALLLVLGGVLGGGWWFTQGRFEATPSLVQLPAAQAAEVAGSNGLRLVTHEEFSETVPKGAVVRTSPAAGDKVVRDGEVTAWVSAGPERHAMPAIDGLTRDEATSRLQAASLAVGTVTERWSDQTPAGRVISSTQDPGDQLRRDEPVDFVVSKGPRPVDVPQLVGRPATEARRALAGAGLKVDASEQFSDTVAKGAVISQSPSSGTARRGDVVRLVVSRGPDVVVVPDVQGLTEKQATDRLTAAGFTVNVNHATPGWLRDDKVRAVDPGAGRSLKRGSTVTLWVI